MASHRANTAFQPQRPAAHTPTMANSSRPLAAKAARQPVSVSSAAHRA